MMKLNYFYRQTKKIEEYLQKLEVLKQVVKLIPPLPHIEENIRHRSILKSSLFSARIEGNKLRIEEIRDENLERKPDNLAKLEVFNISKALRFLYSPNCPKRMSINLLLNLHRLVMQDIHPEAGYLRKEHSAVFNQAGVAIYMTPPPNHIPLLLDKLIKKASTGKKPAPIKAALCHFAFEKIHPFLDGNGRVGRLVTTFILNKGDFDFRGLVSFEEYLDYKREAYYQLLGERGSNITHFVEFFLEGLVHQTEKVIEEIKGFKEERHEDSLLPRRREILEIIKDHQMVSFDFIRRRFVKIPESSLHYDLKKLLEGKFIKKLGSTRGVVYTP